jgi:hypothetical protein
VNALGAARLLLALAAGLAVASLAAAAWSVWLALVLGAVSVMYVGAAWLAVESHRSLQEWSYQQRRAIGRWSL